MKFFVKNVDKNLGGKTLNTKEIVVRIINPSPRPALPKANLAPAAQPEKRNGILEKTFNILMGSGVGFGAGMLIYLMLRSFGINFEGVESSVIIGLPAILGVLTSLSIF